MADTFEQRIKDLEDLMTDLPSLLNLRLEGLTSAQAEMSKLLKTILARLPG